MIKVLKNIPVELDDDKVFARLHINKEMQDVQDTKNLLDQVRSVINPKAVYTIGYIDSKREDGVTINGVDFSSRILRVNLDSVHRVFPYIVTCGKELDQLGEGLDDFLMKYYLDEIKAMAVYSAGEYLKKHIMDTYQLKKVAMMNPGSLEDWPISQQRPLFSIFGDVEELIGMTLTDSFLMVPMKSASGIFFPTEKTFESCQLCPRENCPGRRAPYDETLKSAYFS